jgi:MFS family permease
LGASTAFVGLVEGIAESTTSVLQLVSGWLSDKIQKRRTLMLWGYSLSAVTRPLIAIATSGWHILAVRLVEKVGKGIRVPPRDALIADSCTLENRGKGFGLHRSMDNVGSILGPLLAFSLLRYLNNDYRSLFWVASIPAFLAIGILIFWVSEKPRGFSRPDVPAGNGRFNLKQFNKTFKTFLIATTVFELGNSSNAFLLIRVKDLGLSLELIPIIYLFCNIFKTISSMPGGMLSDKLGRRNILSLGWIVYGLTYLGFAYTTSVNQAWIIFGIYGLFSGMTEGIKKALVADLVPKEVRGSAYGIHSFLTSFSQLPASLILGILWQKYSAALAFSVGGGLAIVAGCVLMIFIPAKTKEGESP